MKATMTMTKAHLKEFIKGWKEMGITTLDELLVWYANTLDSDVIIEYEEIVPVTEPVTE